MATSGGTNAGIAMPTPRIGRAIQKQTATLTSTARIMRQPGWGSSATMYDFENRQRGGDHAAADVHGDDGLMLVPRQRHPAEPRHHVAAHHGLLVARDSTR